MRRAENAGFADKIASVAARLAFYPRALLFPPCHPNGVARFRDALLLLMDDHAAPDTKTDRREVPG